MNFSSKCINFPPNFRLDFFGFVVHFVGNSGRIVQKTLAIMQQIGSSESICSKRNDQILCHEFSVRALKAAFSERISSTFPINEFGRVFKAAGCSFWASKIVCMLSSNQSENSTHDVDCAFTTQTCSIRSNNDLLLIVAAVTTTAAGAAGAAATVTTGLKAIS